MSEQARDFHMTSRLMGKHGYVTWRNIFFPVRLRWIMVDDTFLHDVDKAEKLCLTYASQYGLLL